MPEQVLIDPGIWIAGRDYAGVSNKVSLSATAATPEKTVFKGGWKDFAAGGLKTAAFSIEGFFDTVGPDAEQFASLGTERSVMVVPAGMTPGDVAYIVPVAVSGHQLGASIGELLAFTYAAEGDGRLTRAQVLDIREGLTADAVTPRLGVGPVSAAQTVRAFVHVLRRTGSLDLNLRSSTAQAGGATTSRAIRNGITASGLYELTFTGTTTNQWWFLDYDITGASDFDIAAAVKVS